LEFAWSAAFTGGAGADLNCHIPGWDLSNPLFTLANNSIARTPVLQSPLVTTTQLSADVPDEGILNQFGF